MKVIITGATGMVGGAVLLECIESSSVDKILLINRHKMEVKSDKVFQVIHKDFTDFSAISNDLEGYNACFHCMGVSSVGMDEERYTMLTFDVTKSLADILFNNNENLVFNYVSGTGSDETEKSSSMWKRVKGQTENYILNKGFKDAYAFRPGAILPEKGVKSKTPLYNALYVVMRPFFGLFKKLDSIITSSEIGQAMINSVLFPQELKFLENKDISQLANKSN